MIGAGKGQIMGASRLEAFGDGVFAIAIPLLIPEIGLREC